MKASFQKSEQRYYTKEYLKKPSKGYPQLDWRSIHPNRNFLQEIRNVASKGSKLLDLGCGLGRLSVSMAKDGLEVWGIDFAPSAIKRAEELTIKEKQNKRTHFVIGNALALPYKERFFNVIFDYGCLHHIEKRFWSLYIKNVSRVLKSGGYLILYTHGYDSKFYEKYSPTKTMDEFVVKNVLTHFFKKQDFNFLFKKYFKVVSIKRTNHPATKNKQMWTVVLKRK